MTGVLRDDPLQVKEVCGVMLSNEDVFMSTQFGEFARTMVVFSRGGGGKKAQGESRDSTDVRHN